MSRQRSAPQRLFEQNRKKRSRGLSVFLQRCQRWPFRPLWGVNMQTLRVSELPYFCAPSRSLYFPGVLGESPQPMFFPPSFRSTVCLSAFPVCESGSFSVHAYSSSSLLLPFLSQMETYGQWLYAALQTIAVRGGEQLIVPLPDLNAFEDPPVL